MIIMTKDSTLKKVNFTIKNGNSSEILDREANLPLYSQINCNKSRIFKILFRYISKAINEKNYFRFSIFFFINLNNLTLSYWADKSIDRYRDISRPFTKWAHFRQVC